jgi:serine/threonine-protein kinase
LWRKALQGQAGQLNEYLIGVEVYDRPPSFDSEIDTIVRSEARRLRAKLRQYYDSDGVHDPIVIEVPKGTYAPVIREREKAILEQETSRMPSRYPLLEKLALPPAISSIPRLTVLPFESRTPGEENQALSYAISDSLIARLAKLPGLQVPSWTSVLRLAERKATLSEMADLLKVGYVLEGSLLRSGQNGRVTAQLIHVADESHIWAEEFNFLWKDIFTIQQKVSEAVVRQISSRVGAEDKRMLARQSPHNLKAYEAYARGRYSLVRYNNFRDPEYLEDAERRFNEALETEPKYADALADLGQLCFLRLYPPYGDHGELVTRGISYLQTALTVDPGHVFWARCTPSRGGKLCSSAERLSR